LKFIVVGDLFYSVRKKSYFLFLVIALTVFVGSFLPGVPFAARFSPGYKYAAPPELEKSQPTAQIFPFQGN